MSEQENLFDFSNESIDLGSMDGFDPFDVEGADENIVDIFDSTTTDDNPSKMELEQGEKFSEKVQSTPPTQEETELENSNVTLLDVVINKHEDEAVKNAMGSIFSQPPIFKFSNIEEEITDSKLTFEGLRKEKETDFPEFADSGKVSWSVTYGKITKQVSDPKKKVIFELKKEIEVSKEFLDSLKKSKDK